MTNYFVANFPLLCICISMFFMIVNNYKNNKKFSLNVIMILLLCLVLSVTVQFELYGRIGTDKIVLATIMSYLGYVIRPVILYYFIRMSDKEKLLPTWVFIALLSINTVMYFPSLFINTIGMKFAFYYTVDEINNTLVFNRGYVNFTSHIVSALLLLYVIIVSFKLMSSNHKSDGLVILTCSLFVIVAVVLESISITNGVNLLNITAAVSCVFYYLFIYRDRNRRDALTNLFNRKTYYEDLSNVGSRVVGVIQIDMNGLKFINDTQGHEEGDKAIKAIAKAIVTSIKKDMAAYRMGGDEFLIFSTRSSKESLVNVLEDIKTKIEECGYYCSFGLAYKENKEDYESLAKLAEEAMYFDKAEFYKKHHEIERRK